MLNVRLVGVVPVKDNRAVQSVGFQDFLPIGRPEICVEFLDRWGIDEIVLVDISATRHGRGPDMKMIERCARRCHVPLAVGGGITTLDEVHAVLSGGADRIVLNTAAHDRPELIEAAAAAFGAQSVIVSMDARPVVQGYEVYVEAGDRATGLSPAQAARRAESHGAGEILINSIMNDGAKSGYDLSLLREVYEAVRVPVTVLGGVGKPSDFAAGLNAGASALAAANFFTFTEHSVALAKRDLLSVGANVRITPHLGYENASLDADGRLLRQDEDVLEDLMFVRIVEEVI